jgi:hypothetical protein
MFSMTANQIFIGRLGAAQILQIVGPFLKFLPGHFQPAS